MRKEVATAVVVGVLGLAVAGPASADPAVLAYWPFDEGAGQTVADVSLNGHDGRLGPTLGIETSDPGWTTGHDGGGALSFSGTQFVPIPDTASLEPAHVAVDAWVRAGKSPGLWRYILSKGSLTCERSAYGLYSGWGGGMAFYVSSSTRFTISPEASAATVWDGAWHHVIGSYDGQRVRLWIDGSLVGGGTPTTATIDYGSGSKGIYLGIYRGSCDLGFSGAIDDVRVWNDRPPDAAAPGPVITPVPGTPGHVDLGDSSGPGPQRRTGGTSGGSGSGSTTGSGGSTTSCLMMSLSRKTVPVRKRATVVATVRRGKKTIAGVHVLVSGGGTSAAAKTDRKGKAKISVRARKKGRLKVVVRGQKSSCPGATVRAQ